MLKSILSKLENPDFPLLGPNVKALQFWGVLLPENAKKKYIYIVINAFVFIFTFTEYLDIWFTLSDAITLLTNLKITLMSTICCYKVATFLIWQDKWKDIIDYVTETDVEARLSEDREGNEIIDSYTRYSRKITYPYWIMLLSTTFFMAFEPVVKFYVSESYRFNVRNGTQPLEQVIDSWLPFEKTTMLGFSVASAYQAFASAFGAGWLTSFDTNAIVIMIFFKGQLELIKKSASKIFDEDNDEAVMKNIIVCHKRYAKLIKYFTLFNSCLSPVMFFYMLVCSIVLCASIYQTIMETSFVNQVIFAQYLFFGVSQLFLFCWHGNDVAFTSHQVVRGLFESDWRHRNLYRRELMLLGYQLDQRISFSAGPFFRLDVPNFINIVKAAYSYYTLMK